MTFLPLSTATLLTRACPLYYYSLYRPSLFDAPREQRGLERPVRISRRPLRTSGAAPFRLPSVRRRESRRGISNANFSVIGHSRRLGTNRRKWWGSVSHPDCAVVFDCRRGHFYGDDFFHGFLQYLDPTQAGHTKGSMVNAGLLSRNERSTNMRNILMLHPDARLD